MRSLKLTLLALSVFLIANTAFAFQCTRSLFSDDEGSNFKPRFNLPAFNVLYAGNLGVKSLDGNEVYVEIRQEIELNEPPLIRIDLREIFDPYSDRYRGDYYFFYSYLKHNKEENILEIEYKSNLGQTLRVREHVHLGRRFYELEDPMKEFELDTDATLKFSDVTSLAPVYEQPQINFNGVARDPKTSEAHALSIKQPGLSDDFLFVTFEDKTHIVSKRIEREIGNAFEADYRALDSDLYLIVSRSDLGITTYRVKRTRTKTTEPEFIAVEK